MSLDVYLRGPSVEVTCVCPSCCGVHQREVADEFYSANITHNLGRMAGEAGVYQAIWRPEEIGATKAADLIELLACGLEMLRSEPERFKQFDAPNGWGRYEHLVQFVANYLEACRRHPEALIGVSR